MGCTRTSVERSSGPRERRVVVGLRPLDRSRRQVAQEFRALVAGGARLLPAGEARRRPSSLLESRYVPRHAVSLFDVTYYLTDFRFEEGLDFFVGYVALASVNGSGPGTLHPRIFYKDSSLVWRVASHLCGDGWIGKGDVRVVRDRDGERLASDEDSSNLPYEIQTAFDVISRRRPKRRDDNATRLVLRSAPASRIRPYADFTTPRRRAEAAHPLNGGRPVARIRRRGDPTSLHFSRGFEPDFERILEVDRSGSRLYGGVVRKYRIASRNGLVQYQLVASPTHVWINPPQALTTEITSYGIRAIYVRADEEIFVPGYEYHYVDDSVDPPELHSQIPPGWAGAPSSIDPGRADASAWIEALPVIREFRRRVLGRNKPRDQPIQ
jgi:hypothetical protein